MERFTLFIVNFLYIFLLSSCGGSGGNETAAPKKTLPPQVINRELKINFGGYSWWSSEFIQKSKLINNIYYVTGVSSIDERSKQWVAEVKVTELGIELIDQITLFDQFKGDEHNAPSILSTDRGVVLALTGHGDDFSPQTTNKIFIYSGKSINNLTKIEINSPAPATYTTLLSIESDIILFTRIEGSGIHYSVSSDQGKSWSDFEKILGNGYYANIKKDSINNELIFYIGLHPNSETQYIKVTRAFFNGTHILPLDVMDANEEGVLKGSSFESVYAPEYGSQVRILSSQIIDELNIILFAEYSEQDKLNLKELWDLKIATQKDDHDWVINNIALRLSGALGHRTSVYSNGYYIYGGSVNYLSQDLVEVMYAHKDGDTYKIDKKAINLNLHDVKESINIVNSSLEIYRPIIFKDSDNTLLMFNEAVYWTNYFSWESKQVLKLINN